MNIYKKTPRFVKEIYRFFKRGVNRLQAVYWGHVINTDPEKHAVHESKREKQTVCRPVNLKDPVYFNEKLLWLKYYIYNKSPLIAQCYNKYEVRRYVESKGLGCILNDLYGVWDAVEEIPWDTLPEAYVMKVSNGYAGHVFKRKGEPFSTRAAIKQLKATKRKYDYYYKITGDLFVAGTPQKIICERMLHSSHGYTAPEDYKIYCFHGEPMFVEYIEDRAGSSDYNYKEYFCDIHLNDRHELEGEAKPGVFQPPVCFDEMLKIARILSADFPFVRVDLYVEDDRPIFGELTFTPTHVQTIASEKELGQLIDLSKARILERV